MIKTILLGLAIVFAIAINIIMFGVFIGDAIGYFNKKYYTRFGLALGVAMTNLFTLIKIFLL